MRIEAAQGFLSLSLSTMPRANAATFWTDVSDDIDYVFYSGHTQLCLKKRVAYPITFAYVLDSKLYFGYGIRKEHEINQPMTGAESYLFRDEFLIGCIDAQNGSAELRRDAFATLPLYYASDQNKAYISDSLPWITGQLPRLAINDSALASFLFAPCKNNHTLLKGIEFLPERSVFSWYLGESHLLIPQELPALPTESQPAKFMTALNETFESYWQKVSGVKSVFEVSGGLDSATMPQYLATVHGTRVLMAYLQHSGAFGASQQRKVEDIRRKVADDLIMIPLTVDDAPFLKYFMSGYEPFYQYSEIYATSFERLMCVLEEQGVQVVFRGIGGDELYESISYPKPQPQLPYYIQQHIGNAYLQTMLEELPFTLGSPTAYGAKLSANKQYIDHGIWPISPLADPLLYRFTQNLPLICRGKKNIMRKYHKAYGFAESVFQADQNEDFSRFFDEVVANSIQSYLRKLLTHSMLQELKLINSATILRGLPTVISRKNSDELFALYRLASLEIILQSIADKLYVL